MTAGSAAQRTFCFGAFELDEAAGELCEAGRRVPLEPIPFRLLLYLLEQRARIVSRSDLVRDVWGVRALSPAALYGALKAVRAALGDSGTRQQWIETRARQGYRFVGAVDVRSRDARPAQRAPAPTPCFGVPRNRSLCFFGRSPELSALERAFAQGPGVQLALEGLAGAGKTELALQAVHALASDGRFPGGIFWLEAETLDLRPAWIAALGERAVMGEGPIEERCARLLRSLESAGAPLLVVLDNVHAWRSGERPEPLPAGAHVHVLATTRVRNLGGAQFQHLEVSLLEPPHDRELLLALAGREAGPGVPELLAHLDGLALALELAGAFLRTHPGETAADYLAALQDRHDAVERAVVDRTRYERTASQAFQAVWRRLPRAARQAWRMASAFQPEPASRALAASVGLDAPALRSLEAQHLIRSGADGSWVMHRLTRAYAQSRLRAGERAALHGAFVRGCHARLASAGGSEADVARSYALDRPHLDAALELACAVWGEREPRLAELRAEIARGRAALGDMARARELLEAVVAFYRSALACPEGVGDASARVQLQLRLGKALLQLGQREARTDRLEQAIECFEAALAGSSRESAPLEWAACQHQLGAALRVLGPRPSQSAHLERAVDALERALEIRTRERDPQAWAATHYCLGGALRGLGDRDTDADRLERAAASYRAVLQVYTRERAPFQWADVQHNLANVLRKLGEREPGSRRLEEAIQGYRGALEERPRGQMPLLWASTQMSLGNALCALAEREEGCHWIELGIAAYRAGLEERARERVPHEWANSMHNLGYALCILGRRKSSRARLLEAVRAFRAALEELTRERMARQWALTLTNLGVAECALGELEPGTRRLEAGLACFRAALEELRRERSPMDWAATQRHLADALRCIGMREPGTERLHEALCSYRSALEEVRRDALPLAWAETQRGIGLVLAAIAEREPARAPHAQAREALHGAREVWRASGFPWLADQLAPHLGALDAALARGRARELPRLKSL